MDHGPHSGACATAEGGDCYCDCHGAKHGITHLAGTVADRMAQITTKAVHKNGKVSHYRVTGEDGMPPGGGTPEERIAARAQKITPRTTNKVRGEHTMPAHVLDRAAKVRADLPTDRNGWVADVPRGTQRRDYAHQSIARIIEDRQVWADKRQKLVDELTQRMESAGLRPAQIRKELASGKYTELNRTEIEIDAFDRQLAELHQRLETVHLEEELEPPRDPSGWAMPSAETNKRLDAVLDVGNQALGAIHAAFDQDAELRDLRAQLAVEELTGSSLQLAARRRQIRAREAAIIREMLRSARPFGGGHHADAQPLKTGFFDQHDGGKFVQPAREDWALRLALAEHSFPDDWLARSREHPLQVVSSDRAYYSEGYARIAFPSVANDKNVYDGAYRDYTDEVVVHELGHRMEQHVPGIKNLEHAFVMRRSTGPDGTLIEQPEQLKGGGYAAHEVAFYDRWRMAYAGKVYANNANKDLGAFSWEVFQVGTQDLFGRGSTRYDDDELQAFTLGVLLTVGRAEA